MMRISTRADPAHVGLNFDSRVRARISLKFVGRVGVGHARAVCTRVRARGERISKVCVGLAGVIHHAHAWHAPCLALGQAEVPDEAADEISHLSQAGDHRDGLRDLHGRVVASEGLYDQTGNGRLGVLRSLPVTADGTREEKKIQR
jgi:hypothetical protein